MLIRVEETIFMVINSQETMKSMCLVHNKIDLIVAPNVEMSKVKADLQQVQKDSSSLRKDFDKFTENTDLKLNSLESKYKSVD